MKTPRNTNPKEPYLSIVIPAYNEEKRLPKSLAEIRCFLKSQPFSYEVIVVSDGSQDGTVKLVRRLAKNHRALRVIDNKVNRGKGAVVRDGVLSARGKYILIADADNATPIEELNKLLVWVDKFPIVFGSRHKPGAKIMVKQGFWRVLLSRASNLLIRFLLLPGIYDTQCGFKLFEANAAKTIFPLSTIDHFGWDFEVLAIARELGYTFFEQPIVWYNDPESKVRAGRDAFRTLQDLLKVRWNMLQGRYYQPLLRPAPKMAGFWK